MEKAGRLAENVMHFARLLRAAGLRIGPDRVVDCVRALEIAGAHQFPLRRDDWDGMKRLRDECVLPVFADESCLVEADVDRCAGLFTGINIKIYLALFRNPAAFFLTHGHEFADAAFVAGAPGLDPSPDPDLMFGEFFIKAGKGFFFSFQHFFLAAQKMIIVAGK